MRLLAALATCTLFLTIALAPDQGKGIEVANGIYNIVLPVVVVSGVVVMGWAVKRGFRP